MSAGFTPGPWQLRNALSAAVLAMREHTNHVGHKTAWLSPVAVAQPWAGKQRLANAHLIAAAPDLYEALSELHRACLGTPVCGGDGGTYAAGTPSGSMLNKANAALAKARGEA